MEMTMEQLMDGLRREFGGIGPALKEVNDRMTTEKDERTKRDAAVDEMITELRTRLDRGEQFREEGRRVRTSTFDRTLVPEVSRECGEYLMRAMTRTLDSTTPANGAVTVNPEFIPELLQIVETFGQARQYLRVVPMGKLKQTYPTLDGTVEAYWIDENAAPPADSDPGGLFGSVELDAKTLAAIVPAPESLLEDSDPAMGQIIAEVLGRAHARKEDLAAFQGLGTGGQEPFVGILADANVNDVPFANGQTTIALAGADLADYLLDMQDAVPANSLLGAGYFMHRSVLNRVKRLKSSTGAYIYQAPQNGEPATLWDYPVYKIESLPTAGSVVAGTSFAFFGNPRYAMIGDRKIWSLRTSDAPGFSQFQIYFRASERIAIKVALPQGLSKLTSAAA